MDPFALPRIDQIINSMAGCEILCFLDAYSGYHQIRWTSRTKKKTFITPSGAFYYTSMLFRLKNAGATYQRTVQNCQKEQIGRNVHAYVDDIVIKTEKDDSLIKDLEENFANLHTYQMKLNPVKCTFGVPAGKPLGYIISEKCIEENP